MHFTEAADFKALTRCGKYWSTISDRSADKQKIRKYVFANAFVGNYAARAAFRGAAYMSAALMR